MVQILLAVQMRPGGGTVGDSSVHHRQRSTDQTVLTVCEHITHSQHVGRRVRRMGEAFRCRGTAAAVPATPAIASRSSLRDGVPEPVTDCSLAAALPVWWGGRTGFRRAGFKGEGGGTEGTAGGCRRPPSIGFRRAGFRGEGGGEQQGDAGDTRGAGGSKAKAGGLAGKSAQHAGQVEVQWGAEERWDAAVPVGRGTHPSAAVIQVSLGRGGWRGTHPSAAMIQVSLGQSEG